MYEAVMPLQLGDVTDAERGREFRDRRLRLGMSVRQLAEQADVDRGRLAALEAGHHVRETTAAKVGKTLDRIEEEFGMDDGEPENGNGMVEFKVSGNFGVDVVVKGPVENLDVLEASVARLVSRMQRETEESPPPL